MTVNNVFVGGDVVKLQAYVFIYIHQTCVVCIVL